MRMRVHVIERPRMWSTRMSLGARNSSSWGWNPLGVLPRRDVGHAEVTPVTFSDEALALLPNKPLQLTDHASYARAHRN